RMPRLLVGVGKRHVARGEVEVGAERSDVMERRAEPVHFEDARVRRRGDAAAADAVAAEAVGGVETFAAFHLDAAPGLGGGARREREREREQGREPPHDPTHGSWTMAPTPLRTMMTRKSRLPSAAATTKKCRRPSGGGSV